MTRGNARIVRSVIAGVRATAQTAAAVFFLPGYLVAGALPIVLGRAQGAKVRTYPVFAAVIRAPYRAGDTQVSWLRLARDCFIVQLTLGAVLLAPLCLRALGSVAYMLPMQVRQSALLVSTTTDLPAVGRFTSRFGGFDYYRYWAGIACWVTAMPSRNVRTLARVEADRRSSAAGRAWLAILNSLALFDDRLAGLGLNVYVTSGVLLAVGLLFVEVHALGFLTA